jgi:hypothetical protein
MLFYCQGEIVRLLCVCEHYHSYFGHNGYDSRAVPFCRWSFPDGGSRGAQESAEFMNSRALAFLGISIIGAVGSLLGIYEFFRGGKR